ncbi:unnamed protein product [Darwinula stevensoni]|uniref:G-protein coupled receptors family 2 profile 2 domain-containing protein n=1 Tax=Darwinula stevensoni TaxID=69355 RepID=A0A7R9A4L7_9CRUS|nr:unnamed protein product [Darwinula stevensoni]CAG0884539.1 unnamed protein product [Darwinula stevensoni]
MVTLILPRPSSRRNAERPPPLTHPTTSTTSTTSTVLLFFVGATLILFLFLRVFTTDRVIQMNMEIALALAHVCLLFPSQASSDVVLCRVLSILLHLFFTACFMFMFLEALHMYALVSYVVRKDGLLSRFQNVLVGWGIAICVTLVTLCFCYEKYGGPNQ